MKRYFYSPMAVILLCATPFVASAQTPNQVAKYLTSTSFINSQITDDGTNVGVGIMTPTYHLDVKGDVNTYGRYRLSGLNGLFTKGDNLFGGPYSGDTYTTLGGPANQNTAFGVYSGASVNNGSFNSYYGTYAGAKNDGEHNVFVGYRSGLSSEYGSYNTYAGSLSGAVSKASGNTSIGYRAGYQCQSGKNVFVGFDAAYNHQYGGGNTIIGFSAGVAAQNQEGNTFLGVASGSSNVNSYNTFLGASSGTSNYKGEYNTALGVSAGDNNVDGSYNIYLGPRSGTHDPDVFGSIALGVETRVKHNYQMVVGESTTYPIKQVLFPTTGHFQIGGSVLGGPYTLEVNGSIGGISLFIVSDQTYKKNVQGIENGMDKIMKLRPVSYEWKTSEYPKHNFAAHPGSHLGFLAQEVEKVIPEAIHKDAEGHYMYSPADMLPVVVKALQELQAEMAEMKKILDAYTSSSGDNTSSLQPLTEIQVELSDKNAVVLRQNVPNPFAEQTAIDYVIPENAVSAQVLFYEAGGKLIKVIEIKERGTGRLNIFAADLSSGAYTYTLIVDNKVVETKRMVKQ